MTISNKDIAAQLRTNANELTANANELTALANQVDPPVSTTPTPSTTGPVGIGGNWNLKWSDEFTASSVDLTKWRKGRPSEAAGGHHGYAYDDKNKELGFYLPNQVSVRDGNLVLTAAKRKLNVLKNPMKQGVFVKGLETDTFNSPVESGMWDYETGTVTTGADLNGWVSAMANPKPDGSAGSTWTKQPPTLAMEPGVFIEARIKLPKGKGLWPALWLLPTDGSWSFEVDILEVVDPACRRLAQHLHANNGAIDYTANPGLGLDVGVDMSADFHTFGLDWTKEYVRWYFDGKLTQETNKNVPNVPMYLIANLAVGGSWPGDPDSITRFPAEMVIDKLRCWQRA
jgi:beta-glucanase (GH16 family)